MHDIFIPVMGMAPDDVTLVSWLKQPGDAVRTGDVVALVETSKAELEVESAADGVLGRHLVAELDSVAPGTTIAKVLADGEQDDAPSPFTSAAADAARSASVVDGAVGARRARRRAGGPGRHSGTTESRCGSSRSGCGLITRSGAAHSQPPRPARGRGGGGHPGGPGR